MKLNKVAGIKRAQSSLQLRKDNIDVSRFPLARKDQMDYVYEPEHGFGKPYKPNIPMREYL